MEDHTKVANSEPRCSVCCDLSGRVINGPIANLKMSANKGCVICSFIYEGIQIAETEKYRAHLRLPLSCGQGERGDWDNDPPWTYFSAFTVWWIPNGTFQVVLGRETQQSDMDKLEFHTTLSEASEIIIRPLHTVINVGSNSSPIRSSALQKHYRSYPKP
jgi:hypothetical protein